MRLLLIILTSILCTAFAFAQLHIGWVQRFNGLGNSFDGASAIAADAQGNVYVTGTSHNGTATITDYTTIKYDSNGNQLWVARYDGPANFSDGASALSVDDKGNVYVTGSSTGNGTASDYATIKYYSTGDTTWVRRYNGSGNVNDRANAIYVDVSSNVYVTGSSYGAGTSEDFATVKYDSSGNQLWVSRYNGPANLRDFAWGIGLDTAGNVYVTGSSFDSLTKFDYATVKYDSQGNQLWAKRYDGPGNWFDNPAGIALDISGNVYVTGNSPDSSDVNSNDYATIKYDSQGNQIWVRRYNGPANRADGATAITLDSMGNVYVTGFSNSVSHTFVADSSIFATIKYDSNGNQLWVACYKGESEELNDSPSAIAVDMDGNVYVTGGVDGQSSDIGGYRFSDFVTIKYDPNGNQFWVGRYGAVFGSTDRAIAIALDEGGNVYVAGYSDLVISEPDYATIKYTPVDLLKGDLDGNGVLNLNDIVLLLNCVFLDSGDCPPSFADINCDAFLTPSDVVILLNISFLSMPSPC